MAARPGIRKSRDRIFFVRLCILDFTCKLHGAICQLSTTEDNKMTVLQDARKEKHLLSEVRFQGEIMTRREMVIRLQEAGSIFREVEVPKIKPLSRMAFFRADMKTQRDHEARMKAAGNKTVYEAETPEGILYDISKIQYDYAVGQKA